jgi:phosphoribosylformylglycinamidine (FGAM) synthase-like amidotransferase family enzyme
LRLEVYAPGVPPAGDILVVPPGLPAPLAPESLAALRAFAEAGGKLLGLADGVAWLCAAALLPGDVTTAPAAATATHVRVEGRATPFTWAIPAGRIVTLARPALGPRYIAPEADVRALAARGQIVLRYCDPSGGLAAHGGADQASTVAGLCDESGRVVGVLAPSTQTFDTDLGRQLLTCLKGRGD